MKFITKPKTFWLPIFFLLGFLIQVNTSCDFGPPEGSRAKQAERGKPIFKEQCSRCHGMGDILPTVDTLQVKAPDLTKINKRRGLTEFPVAKIARIIDGRLLLKEHGSRDMPIWGEVYSQDGMDETEIKGRKGELIAYLMSIQNYE